MAEPIVSWYLEENKAANEITGTVNYGTVDADTQSATKTMFIWNNRAGATDVAKMQNVQYTTRDRKGGLGDTVGSVVEAVKNNWFNVRVDTLDEVDFKPVGKGGAGTANVSGVAVLGTKGVTKNPKAAKAVAWAASTELSVGAIIAPKTENGFIYEVKTAGTTGTDAPTFVTVEDQEVADGTVVFVALAKEHKPGEGEILGAANAAAADGSNVADAAGNFAKVSVYVDVPVDASAGKNLLIQRVFYQYV